MVIEFADFFALLQPSSNVSNVGRVPQKLEAFRISLPCSGRITTEVPVIIRFTFNVKHTKHNITLINVKRNKICLLKEQASEGPGTKKKNTPDSGLNAPPGFSNINATSSLLFPNGDPASPRLLLAGLLGGCAVTGSIVFLTFFICLRRKLLKLHHEPSQSSCSGSCTNSCRNSGHQGDPSSSNNSSPACLLRQVQGDSGCSHHQHHSHAHSNMTNTASTTKWLTPAGLLGSNFTTTAKDNKFLGGSNNIANNPPGNSSLVSRSSTGSPNSYVTIASFWNDIFSAGAGGGNTNGTSGNGSTASQCPHLHGGHGHHQMSNNNCPRASKVSSNLSSTSATNNMMNTSTFRNSPGVTITKGSDVSPYAYAQILGLPPPPQVAPPVPLIPSPLHSQPPPPLIEWYSQSNNLGAPASAHIYSNHLYTFSPSLSGGASQVVQKSPKHPKDVCNSSGGGGGSGGPDDGNCSTTGRSTAGSESLIQIDGFQCRKNFRKETNVVERFL